jgi:hypothetical protein
MLEWFGRHPAKLYTIRQTSNSPLISSFNTYDLDALVNQNILATTNLGLEVTNKTKLTINGTPAYNVQFNGINMGTGTASKHITGHIGEKVYDSVYLMIRQDTIYMIAFTSFNPTKFLPLEHKIIQSFRFT